jgi:hypothetical protein
MNAAHLLGVIGLIGAALCIAAYAWGYIINVQGFRPLAVLALFSTVVAMAQLGVMLTDAGGRINAVYAMAFLLVSGLAQAWGALKGRPDRRDARTRETDRTA